MLIAELVATHAAVAATRSRKEKTAALASALASAAHEDLPIVVSWLGGSLLQRRTGLGWRGLQTLPAPSDSATLEVREVHDAFEHLAG
ncbi:MAG TPA: ATP-dependent DNA ligase, partial [Pseudonocardia sp.]|nr:ATP-dependent DNA ligase [Pseudonocardia sp.]